MDSIPAIGLSRPEFNPSHQQKFFFKFFFQIRGDEFRWGVSVEKWFRWSNVSVEKCFGEMFQWGKEENLGAMGDHFKLIRITLALKMAELQICYNFLIDGSIK